MSDFYNYRVGRETFKGVEVCEYNREGRPDEQIKVIAHAVGLRTAQSMCMWLNRHKTCEKAPISRAEPLPGSF